MTDTTTDELERALVRDLEVFGDRLRDEQLAAELYRALTNTAWSRRGGPEGLLSFSEARAGSIVNGLRERHGDAPLPPDRIRGAGGVSDRVERLLEPLGWTWPSQATAHH